MLEDFGSIESLVEQTPLRERQVSIAVTYRDSYPDEIAEAIADTSRTGPSKVGPIQLDRKVRKPAVRYRAFQPTGSATHLCIVGSLCRASRGTEDSE